MIETKEGEMKKKIIIASIVLGIFLITAIFVTYFLIQFKLKSREVIVDNANVESTQPLKVEELVNEKEETLDIYSRYNENDLEVITTDEKINGYDVKVLSIKGLKDKKVEEKINKDIRERCIEFFTKIIPEKYVNYSCGDYYSDFQFYTVSANFSNIFSCFCKVTGDEKDENQKYNSCDWLTLNYELVNGNRIKFEDLFVENATVFDSIPEIYHEILSIAYSTSVEDVYGWMKSEVSEEECYLTVQNFFSGKEQNFYITPYSVILCGKGYKFVDGRYDGSFYEISILDDLAKEVIFYSKYLTDESLFERNDIGKKNLMVGGDYDHRLARFNMPLDNLETFLFSTDFVGSYIEDDTKIIETFKSEFLQKEKELINKAKANPDKFYYYVECLDRPYENYKTTMYSIKKGSHLYEMSKEFYESSFKEWIFNMLRFNEKSRFLYITGGNLNGCLVNEDVNVKYTKKEEIILWDEKEKNFVTKLSDVFHDGVWYMYDIEQKILEIYSDEFSSIDEVQERMKTLNPVIELKGINFIDSVTKEYLYFLDYDWLEPKNLKILKEEV